MKVALSTRTADFLCTAEPDSFQEGIPDSRDTTNLRRPAPT